MESECGIEGFLGDRRGFTCVLKQRYQDFLVNEIDRDGNVVHLTSLDATTESSSVVQKAHVQKQDLATTSDCWSSEIDEQLKALADGERTEAVNISCQDFDKAKRTEIHNAIRERFPKLQSATNSKDGVQSIIVTKAASGQSSRKRGHWPSERKGDYLQFILCKENKDSHFAVALICRLLGMKASSVSLAGTKDRRAVTSQLATIYRISAEQLSALNPQLRGIKVGNFSYCENELFLGDSRGNRFTIIMRNIQADRNFVEDEVKTWSENGFINFFGTQRFGTTSISTHAVGKAILRKQWAEAVDLLLHPRDNAPEDVAECYQVWASTKDPGQALATIPSKRRHTCLEGLLLAGLKKHGLKDFSNAFKTVPRNSRTLYVHGIQSFIWNKLVSKRVAKYGQKLLAGDLVVSNNEDESSEGRTLTEEEIKTAEPFQLRVPLPSANAVFANEEMRQWFDEILAEEGLTRDDFRNAEKEYAVHGGLRQVFIKPSDVQYRFYQYDDFTVPLALTDCDVLHGKAGPESVEGGKYLALSLSFSLPAGSYATMAIRELCRMDTGKQYQSGLNYYSESDGVDEAADLAEGAVGEG